MMDPSQLGPPAGGGGPASQIPLPGGGGGDPIDSGSAVTSPPAGDNSDNLRQSIMLLQKYLEGETDDQDLADGAKILAQAQGLLAKQQKLVDTATGAGPGARLVRKSTASQQSGGGGGY